MEPSLGLPIRTLSVRLFVPMQHGLPTSIWRVTVTEHVIRECGAVRSVDSGVGIRLHSHSHPHRIGSEATKGTRDSCWVRPVVIWCSITRKHQLMLPISAGLFPYSRNGTPLPLWSRSLTKSLITACGCRAYLLLETDAGTWLLSSSLFQATFQSS